MHFQLFTHHQRPGGFNVLNASIHRNAVRMGDSGNLPYLVVRRISERKRNDSHKRPVTVIHDAGATFVLGKCPVNRVSEVENPSVDGVLPLPEPRLELLPHVLNIYAAKLPYAVAGCKDHRSVIRPCARRLVVRAVANHPRCME